MPLDLKAETINKTTECPTSFKCLENEDKIMCDWDKPVCPVTSHIANNSTWINVPEGFDNCPYHVPFLKRHICTCPVRCELFLKYGK